MRKLLLAMVAALALLTFALPGTAVGTSADTAGCRRGGWQELVRADGSAFRNQGECVRYAARGGTPRPPLDAFQQLCADLGGTYAATGVIDGVSVAPYCDAPDDVPQAINPIIDACLAVTGSGNVVGRSVTNVFGCTVA